MSKVRLCVVSGSVAEANLVKSLLEESFRQVSIRTQIGDAVQTFQEPTAFVVTFQDFRRTEEFCERQRGNARPGQVRQDRLVILCSNTNVGLAYDLCRCHKADDYVLFWPITYDAVRLQMSVYNVIKDLESELSRQEAPAQTQADSTHSFTVLVVDDDRIQQKLAGQTLERANYNVKYATTGGDALDLLLESENDIDLVLMDYQMPDMNGLVVTQRLKAEPRLAAIPVIMVTGNGGREMVQRSLASGVADFVVKPFDRTTLLAKLDRILRPVADR